MMAPCACNPVVRSVTAMPALHGFPSCKRNKCFSQFVVFLIKVDKVDWRIGTLYTRKMKIATLATFKLFQRTHTNIPQYMGSTRDLVRKTTPSEHKSVKQIVQRKNYLCKT